MKKRVIAGMMGMVMLIGSTLMISAAETEPAPAKRTMNVGYTEPSTFVMTIPADVSLSETEETTGTVGLTSINVGTKEKVQIKVTGGISEGKVTVTDEKDNTNKVTSQVSLSTGGEAIADDAVVAEFEGTSTTATTGGTLYFAALGGVKAGTYKGQITFQASIVDKN